MAGITNKRTLIWGAVFLWMGVIFYFSSLKGSGAHYYSLSYFLERKALHVIEYFVLAGLLYFALKIDFSEKRSVILALLAAFSYAISDEWHQTFVFGREGKWRDVAIDLLGIILGIFFISNLKKWKMKWWK